MNRQTLFYITLIVVLLSIGYVWFRYSRAPTVVPTGDDAGEMFETRLSQLRYLKDLQLDISIFQNPLFKTLKAPETIPAISQPVIKQGRTNPFLPF